MVGPDEPLPIRNAQLRIAKWAIAHWQCAVVNWQWAIAHFGTGHCLPMNNCPSAIGNFPLVASALRTRCLAWWRFYQEKRLRQHPGRFKVWRWESQLERVYGQVSSPFFDDNVGWMEHAQDRRRWRALSSNFF